MVCLDHFYRTWMVPQTIHGEHGLSTWTTFDPDRFLYDSSIDLHPYILLSLICCMYYFFLRGVSLHPHMKEIYKRENLVKFSMAQMTAFVILFLLYLLLFLLGPPDEPDVYIGDDGDLCFNAIAHPKFPVENFTIDITTNKMSGITSPLSGTHSVTELPYCICLNGSVCAPFTVSAIASNSVGNSSLRITNFDSIGGTYDDTDISTFNNSPPPPPSHP